MTPKPNSEKIPALRTRDGCALVTLTDARTGRRRDYRLGAPDALDLRGRYHRLIGLWEANGRRWPEHWEESPAAREQRGPTIVEVTRAYYRWARRYYHKRYAKTLKVVLRLLRQYYGWTPAAEFGPNKLRLLREAMIRGDEKDKKGKKKRPAWSRRYINAQVKHIRHVFKWAASHELLAPAIHQALCTVEPLKRGRSEARENPRVGPVPEHLLQAVLPHLAKPVKALVELQLLTGARPGELVGLRPCDLEMRDAEGVWLYRPDVHKNAYRDHDRVIYLGPRAQEVVRPFLANRATNAPMFSPAEAEADRRAALHEARETPIDCGNSPGTCRKAEPRKQPGAQYTTPSYNRAVQYACERAFPLPEDLRRRGDETWEQWEERLTPEEHAQVKAWRKAHRWHVHQLRHSAGTCIRREFGLEAAQLALGHASAQITDAVYAERDRAKVMEVMRRIG